ncbi:Ubiquitin- modifier 1 [Gurleya vavrai]
MKVILKGGLEMYFNNKTLLLVDTSNFSSNSVICLKDLIVFLQKNYKETKNTLFRNENELAPGNLCFINKKDIEIYENEEIYIKEGDEICFISTMHGG